MFINKMECIDWKSEINDEIKFHSIEDERGKHIKHYTNLTGFSVDEVYATVNNENTVRGFHGSENQTKIVQVLSGVAQVVIILDNNIVYNEFVDNTHPPIIIKKGVFWGYKAMEDNTVISYVVDGKYDPTKEFVLHPMALGNVFNIDDNTIVSKKDLSGSMEWKDL